MSEKATHVSKPGDKPAVQTKPAGWWALPALEGSRIGVMAAIDSSVLPDRWKDALCGEVNALDAKQNHVKVDAHCQNEKGHIIVAIHIKGSTVL